MVYNVGMFQTAEREEREHDAQVKACAPEMAALDARMQNALKGQNIYQQLILLHQQPHDSADENQDGLVAVKTSYWPWAEAVPETVAASVARHKQAVRDEALDMCIRKQSR